MPSDSVSSSEDAKKSVVGLNTEYNLKTPPLKEQIFFGLKLFTIGVMIFALFWLAETFHFYY